jgi:hypothetical protein
LARVFHGGLFEGFDEFGLHMGVDMDDEHRALMGRPARHVKTGLPDKLPAAHA